MTQPATLADRSAVLPDGTEFAYSIRNGTEQSASPAVVLLHGYCGSSAYWADVLPLLPEWGTWIAPDLKGHGSSSSPEGEVYTMESFADDLERLLQSLGTDRIILFGHSLGGYIAAAFAERYPHRLAGLSLVHSTALPDTDAAREGRDKAAAAIRKDGIERFVESLVPKLFAPESLNTMPAKVEAMKAIGRMTNPQGAAATALGMKVREDRSGVLRELDVPILLAAGERDAVIPQERAFSFDSPRVQREVLERAGHMGMIETPGALAAVMEAFVRRTCGL